MDKKELSGAQRVLAAEKDVRLVVLPCKEGDTIWKIEMLTKIDKIGEEWTICTYNGATVAPLKFGLCHLNSIGERYWLSEKEATERLIKLQLKR